MCSDTLRSFSMASVRRGHSESVSLPGAQVHLVNATDGADDPHCRVGTRPSPSKTPPPADLHCKRHVLGDVDRKAGFPH
jgi:hypothetical protein